MTEATTPSKWFPRTCPLFVHLVGIHFPGLLHSPHPNISLYLLRHRRHLNRKQLQRKYLRRPVSEDPALAVSHPSSHCLNSFFSLYRHLQISKVTVVMRGSLVVNRRAVHKLRQLGIPTIGSVKIKILLCCCIALTLVVLAGRASSLMGWTSHPDSSYRLSSPRGQYAIVMNTWKRYDLLKQSIAHYVSCPRLESIHIVWSEPEPPSESLKRYLNRVAQSNSGDWHSVELKFDINMEDSLNNRFKEIKDLKTDAVFSIDDDVIFPCTSVELAFSVWQSAPDTMVGFVPRVHWVDESKGKDHYTYGGWWSVWWTGTYSMVLSKAAFFHKKYFSLYTNEMPASIREYVTKKRNCEDIAMSFLVANATGAPPIWVKGKIFEIGSTGISSLGGHSERRTECVNRFVTEFGSMPLVSTSVKAVDSRSVWFW